MSLMPENSIGREEEGASLILVALSMVLFLGLAAVAIDGGSAWNERRQQQSAADVGALAAIQFADASLGSENATCNSISDAAAYAACRGAEEAMAVVDGTVPGAYDSSDWAACTDPDKPARFSQGSTLSPCINFTSNFEEARVMLPGVDLNTKFGGFLGINTVGIGAFAEAGLDLDQSADVIPWAVGPTGSGSNYSCLFANSSSVLDIDPCNGPDQGNFGKLDVSLYGNSTIGTPQICGNSSTQTKMTVNLITGADHILEQQWKTSGTVNDWSNCPKLKTPVDELIVQTGNSETGIMDGLFVGTAATTDYYEGRLLCKQGSSDPEGDEYATTLSTRESDSCETIGNQFSEQVDHTPLWNFLEDNITETDPADACDGSGAAAVDTYSEMVGCLQAWHDWDAIAGNDHSEPLFKIGVKDAPRFAAVPILSADPSNGSGSYTIEDFRPVYLDTVYLKCNANTCDVVHSPGIPNSGTCPNPITSSAKSCGWNEAGNKGVVAMTSYVLTVEMLPLEIQEKFPATVGTVVYNLSH